MTYRRYGLAFALALTLSAAVHAFFYWLVHQGFALPSLDLALQRPIQIDFGVQLAKPEPSAEAATSPDTGADEETSEETPENASSPSSTKGVDVDQDEGETTSTAAKTPARKRRSPEKPAAAASNSPASSAATGAEALQSSRLPPGALLAMRLNLAAIRRSPVAHATGQALSLIPDWQLLLRGSGIDPVRDLERLLIASPDLRYETLVVAGQYARDDLDVRAIVARMAARRGVTATWQRPNGLETAPWPADDATQRDVTLLPPRRFVLSRAQDLPPFLAAMRARQAADRSPQQTSAATTGILAMDERELAHVEVEGTRQFVRGRIDVVPLRLLASLRQNEGASFEFRTLAVFESPAQARSAQAYWERQRQRYAGHVLLSFSGMGSVLRSARFETSDNQLTLVTHLQAEQLRMLLGLLQMLTR